VILDSLLQPASILFLIGFLFGLASPQLRARRKMMFSKFMGDGFIGLYLLAVGGMSGACGCFIAATGAFIQAITPHHYLKRTIWPRIVTALVLSAASFYFVYKNPIDILPLSMVIVCRFGELQTQAQRIRFIYWITSFPWMAYHFLNGFYLPLFACILGSMSLLFSIIRHERMRQKTQQEEISD